MDINASALASLNTAFTTAFNTSFHGGETTYGRIAMTVMSSTRHQTYPKLDDLPGMREWVGERVVNRLEQDGFTITNRKFENTIAVSVDDIRDDQVGLFSTLAANFGETARELPDDLMWDKLAAGFTETHYDGQFFFDTDHPVEDANGVEQSVANFTSGAGAAWYLLDTRKTVKPMIFQERDPASFTPKTNMADDNVLWRDEFIWAAKRRCAVGFGAWQLIHASKADLTETNYEAAREAMMGMTGHKGRKLTIRPNLLVVPPSLEGKARKILNAEMTGGGDTNVWRNSAELHVETRLS